MPVPTTIIHQVLNFLIGKNTDNPHLFPLQRWMKGIGAHCHVPRLEPGLPRRHRHRLNRYNLDLLLHLLTSFQNRLLETTDRRNVEFDKVSKP
jgi:hypothetical protein